MFFFKCFIFYYYWINNSGKYSLCNKNMFINLLYNEYNKKKIIYSFYISYLEKFLIKLDNYLLNLNTFIIKKIINLV